MEYDPTRTVWIPNKGPHDYSAAERFGNLEYLTEGSLNRFDVGGMYMTLKGKLEAAQPGDYLIITSLPVLCAIATTILAEKFGTVNFLMYSDGNYVPRELTF